MLVEHAKETLPEEFYNFISAILDGKSLRAKLTNKDFDKFFKKIDAKPLLLAEIEQRLLP